MLQRRIEYIAHAEETKDQATRRILRRLRSRLEDYEQGRVADPPVLEVLILSGGGDFGAFGAGFLRGWGEVTAPEWTRPQFDIVTGVSTGALIAPFAFLGDDESYGRIEALYRQPASDWIRRRGLLFFLPSRQSLVTIDGLKRDVRKEFGEPIVKRLAAGTEQGRVLAIGTTNLDFGRQRIWDLCREASIAVETASNERLVDILLASSAIPGAFPPVKIDDYLYADGAISANILYDDSMRDERDLTSMWAAEYPGVPMPRTRYWVVINGQLEGPPQITQPTWVSVTGAALSTAVRSSTTTALQNLAGQLELINLSGLGRKELHVVSIPSEWRPPREGRFVPETMQALADVGARMGADPSSWQTVVSPPSAAAK
jgi:predicted acylesterase/phospholipase RssA